MQGDPNSRGDSGALTKSSWLVGWVAGPYAEALARATPRRAPIRTLPRRSRPEGRVFKR